MVIKMSKKANISLSVNSIVVLVMAMVMLGLGLGFTRGMFGKMTNEFESQASELPDPVVSYSNPIELSNEKIVANAGDNKAIKVAVFNRDEDNPANYTMGITCDAFDTSVPGKKEIPASSSAQWIIGLGKAVAGSYELCNVSATSTTQPKYTAEFMVEVK